MNRRRFLTLLSAAAASPLILSDPDMVKWITGPERTYFLGPWEPEPLYTWTGAAYHPNATYRIGMIDQGIRRSGDGGFPYFVRPNEVASFLSDDEASRQRFGSTNLRLSRDPSRPWLLGHYIVHDQPNTAIFVVEDAPPVGPNGPTRFRPARGWTHPLKGEAH